MSDCEIFGCMSGILCSPIEIDREVREVHRNSREYDFAKRGSGSIDLATDVEYVHFRIEILGWYPGELFQRTRDKKHTWLREQNHLDIGRAELDLAKIGGYRKSVDGCGFEVNMSIIIGFALIQLLDESCTVQIIMAFYNLISSHLYRFYSIPSYHLFLFNAQ